MRILRPIFLFVLSCLFLHPASAQKPNIILIMTDDQGWADVGFNGNEVLKTPHLDHLASQGIILNRFYAAAPVCSPTRASVITGRNPLRMGISHANAGHMMEGEITLPELLQGQGYNTGHFGKWHLGTLTRTTLDANRGGQEKFLEHYSIPTMHGYDSFFCTESKVPTFDPMISPATFEDGESKHFGWKALVGQRKSQPYGTAYWVAGEEKATMDLEGDNSKIIMDRVIPFIADASQKKQPFFTTIWLHTPHLPVVADTHHRGQYASLGLDQQLYYGTISAMDQQIGRLWQALETLGIDEETIVWFCSDNGPENKTPGTAGIFRERKRSLYEGGLRVPAFVLWKSHFKEGLRMDFPAVTSDYLPTILDILNLNLPTHGPIDGESLLSLLEGGQEIRERPIGFIYGDYKKVSWVNNRYKLISVDNGKNYELYDLIADHSEKENIVDQKKDVAISMKEELDSWLRSVADSQAGADYEILPPEGMND
ncbi:MAG: sulfatase-like hydrolase/transferase [Cyclobacteriaceae bacterium]